PRYSSRRSPFMMKGTTSCRPTTPKMPHMLELSLLAILFAKVRGPTGLDRLAPAGDGQRVGRYVMGQGAAGRHESAGSDRDRRHQNRVGADECPRADHRSVLMETVVIAGDGAGADIRPRAHVGIPDIGQMIGLRPGIDPRVL